MTADFSRVHLTQIGRDRVRVTGAHGRARTDSLKVSLGYYDGFVGEGQISYAGAGATARAELGRDIVEERLRLIGVPLDEVRYDLIGINALHGERLSAAQRDPYEVRLRVAARVRTMEDAIRVGNEVEALYTNGPAGGAGATKSARRVLAIGSTLIARDLVSWRLDTETV